MRTLAAIFLPLFACMCLHGGKHSNPDCYLTCTSIGVKTWNFFQAF